MNKHDRENLEFLLNADKETLKDWYNKMDADDHEYAAELLAQYAGELAIKTKFYDVEEIVSDYTPDANEYIKKFTLGENL